MTKALDQIPFQSADGQNTSLSKYAGKVLMVVNVASKCGLTPQYDALENIFEKYHGRGFEVLAFPANEFAGQEPGTNQEIQDFCRTNFSVKFPVFAKIAVKGETQHPLYQALTSTLPKATKKAESALEKNLAKHGLLGGNPNDIMWNFEKFIVNKKGQVVARFAPDFTPDDPAIISTIEAELARA